ncbi:MAG: alpha/beta hydrolase [Desulfarculus sp.]|nr:alpha/beta hydrolase [Desulfarculus sp.]
MGRHPQLYWPHWLTALLLAAVLAWPQAARAQQAPPVLADLPSLAVPGARVVDLATRTGVRQRLLLLRPPQVEASLILLVGGDGLLNLDQNFALGTRRGNFLKRIAARLARQGFQIALLDMARDESSFFGGPPLRTSAAHAQDLGGVSDFLRQEAPAPVWLVGTSLGTISAANAAGRLGPERVQGVVLSSTNLGGRHQAGVFALDLEAIRQPVLVVHHEQDDCFVCPYHQVPSLLQALTNAPVKEVLAYRGGLPAISEACEALSAHGFYGLEDQVAQDMGQWIKDHAPRP